MAKHDKVEQGSFQYHQDGAPTCDQCFAPPVFKLYLDDEMSVKGINRTMFCSGKPINFSIGVLKHSSVRKKFVDVIRACSSHANYHVHWWHHLSVNEIRIDEKYPLHTVDDVMKAHEDASDNVFDNYEEWIAEWTERK